MTILWGKVIGAVAGIPAGPFGVAFGFVVGLLVDQVVRSVLLRRRVERFLSGPASVDQPPFDRVIAAAVGIGMSVAALECLPTVRQVALLRETVVDYFRLGRRRAEGVQHIIDEAYRLGQALDTMGLADMLRDSTSLLEREELIRLYARIAELDRVGMTPKKRAVLRSVAAHLKVRRSFFQSLFPDAGGLDIEACRLLGVPRDAGLEEVKRVYRRLAQQFHPDAVVDLAEEQKRQAAVAFLRIQAAYEKIVAELAARARRRS